MSVKEIRNFDYIILLCKNMQETRIFYKDVMGFPLEFDADNWVSFRVGIAHAAAERTLAGMGRWPGVTRLGRGSARFPRASARGRRLSCRAGCERCRDRTSTNRPAGLAAPHTFLP